MDQAAAHELDPNKLMALVAERNLGLGERYKKRNTAVNKKRDFDPHAFLATIGEGRKFVFVPKKQRIFAQGDTADSVFHVRTGKVKLTVVSKTGKEATIGILGEGEFFGEGVLAGQSLRMGSATAMTDCQLLQIDKKAMMLALHREHTFSDLFVEYLLARNIRYEEDLVDQLFNSSEKRLARTLLLLAHFDNEGAPETVIPKVSQETLAEMVGTTRSRVSFFMNRFRKSGFVDYGGSGLQVHSSLLNVCSPGLASAIRFPFSKVPFFPSIVDPGDPFSACLSASYGSRLHPRYPIILTG